MSKPTNADFGATERNPNGRTNFVAVLILRFPKHSGGPLHLGRITHLLTLSGVSASYGAVSALDDISINVPRGKTVAVVGESGSGQSITARVITGLLPS